MRLIGATMSSVNSQPAGGKRTIRRRVYELLEPDNGTSAAKYLARLTSFLIACNVVAVVVESMPVSERFHTEFVLFEIGSLFFFSGEYLLRVWSAPEHPLFANAAHSPYRAYIFSWQGLIDAAAVVPFWLSLWISVDVRTLSSLRIVRLLKSSRHSAAMRSLMDALFDERRALFGCFFILLAATLIFATGMHIVERDVQPDKFGTIPDAMWWALVTLGTIGYGDVVPITPIGKMVAAAAVVTGLIMVALPVGIVASAFSDAIHRRDFIVTWTTLAKVPLFANLKAAEIADVLKLLRAQQFRAGETITRRGETAHSMYLVADGEVRIDLPGQQGSRPVILGSGHFFGEVAVLQRTKRSATVTAVTKTRLLVLDAADLHELMSLNRQIADEVKQAARTRSLRGAANKGDLVPEELSQFSDDA